MDPSRIAIGIRPRLFVPFPSSKVCGSICVAYCGGVTVALNDASVGASTKSIRWIFVSTSRVIN